MKKKICLISLLLYFCLMVPGFAMDWPGHQLSTKGAWGTKTAGLGMCKCQLDQDPKDDVIFAWIDDPIGDNRLNYRIILNEAQLIKPDDSYLGSANGWMNSGLGVACGDIDLIGYPDVVFVWVDNPGNSDRTDGKAFKPDEPIKKDNCIYYMIAYNLHRAGNQYKFMSKSKVFTKSENPGIGWRTQGLGAVLLDMDSNPKPELLVGYIDAPSGTNYIHFKALMNIDYHTSKGSYWTGCAKTISLGHNSQGLGMDLIKFNNQKAVVIAAIDNPARNNRYYQSIVQNIRLSNNKVTFDKAVTRTVKNKIGYENQGAAFVALNEKMEQDSYRTNYQYDFIHLAMDNPRGQNRIDTWIQQGAPPIVRIDQEQSIRSGAIAIAHRLAQQSFKTTMSFLTKIEICAAYRSQYQNQFFTIKLLSGGSNGRVLAEKEISLSRNYQNFFWFEFNINPPIKVFPGNEYFIAVDGPAGLMWGRQFNNPYKDGVSYLSGSAQPDADFQFRTWGFQGDYPYE